MKPEEIAKAIVGGIISGASTAFAVSADNVISMSEWIGIFLSFITVFGAVWGVPNAFTKLQLKQAKRELIDLGEVVATQPVNVWPSTTTATAQFPTVK